MPRKKTVIDRLRKRAAVARRTKAEIGFVKKHADFTGLQAEADKKNGQTGIGHIVDPQSPKNYMYPLRSMPAVFETTKVLPQKGFTLIGILQNTLTKGKIYYYIKKMRS